MIRGQNRATRCSCNSIPTNSHTGPAAKRLTIVSPHDNITRRSRRSRKDQASKTNSSDDASASDSNPPQCQLASAIVKEFPVRNAIITLPKYTQYPKTPSISALVNRKKKPIFFISGYSTLSSAYSRPSRKLLAPSISRTLQPLSREVHRNWLCPIPR